MKLTIENFRAHKHKVIELPDTGISLISGPSGIGKTTILEAIAWCLYGTKANVYPLDEKAKRKSIPKVRLELMFHEQPLIIERRKKPNTVIVNYNGSEAESDSAQDFINQYLGSKDMFYMSAYLNQGERNKLLTLSQAEKLDLLRRIALPENSDVLIAQAEEKCKNLNQEKTKLEQEYTLAQESLQRYMKAHNFTEQDYMNKKARQELITQAEELKQTIIKLESELNRLQSEKHKNDILKAQISTLSTRKISLEDQYTKPEIDLEIHKFCYDNYGSLKEYFETAEKYKALSNPDPENLADEYPERDLKALNSINNLLNKYKLSSDCEDLLITYDKLLNSSRIMNCEYRISEFNNLDTYRQRLEHLKHTDYYAKRLAFEQKGLNPDKSRQYYIDLAKKQQQYLELVQKLKLSKQDVAEVEFYLANLNVITLLKDVNNLYMENNKIWSQMGQEQEITEETLQEIIAETHTRIHDLKVQSFECPQCHTNLFLEGSEVKIATYKQLSETEREQALETYKQILKNGQELSKSFQKYNQLNEQVPDNVSTIVATYNKYKTFDNQDLKQFLELIDIDDVDAPAHLEALEIRSQLEEYEKQHKIPKYTIAELEELANLTGAVSELQTQIKELEIEARDYSIYQQLTKEPAFEQAQKLKIDHRELKQLQNLLYQYRSSKWLKTLPKELKIPDYDAIRNYILDQQYLTILQSIEKRISNIESYRAIYQQYNAEYPELKQAYDSYLWALTEIKSLDSQITNLRAQLTEGSEEELDKLAQELQERKNDQQELEPKLKLLPAIEYYAQEYNAGLRTKKQIKKLETDLISHRELLQIMRETEFECLEHNITNINNILERILECLFTTNMRVELSVFKALKTETRQQSNQRLNINLKINNAGYDFDSLNQLSGGEADRISFAITLAMNIATQQPLLLLDEPSSSLDEINRKNLLDILKQYITTKPVLCINHEDPAGFYDFNYRL